MLTQITNGQRVVDARDDRIPRPVHDAVDPTSQRTQDLMVQLVRQGLDVSLRSLQVWADLTRQFGPTALGSPAGATMVSLAYDPCEKLLTAQRRVVDELVITQRQLAHQFRGTTATVGDHPTPR